MTTERTRTGSELDENGVVQKTKSVSTYESSTRITVRRQEDGTYRLIIGDVDAASRSLGPIGASALLTPVEAQHIGNLLTPASPMVPEIVREGVSMWLDENGVRYRMLKILRYHRGSLREKAMQWAMMTASESTEQIIARSEAYLKWLQAGGA